MSTLILNSAVYTNISLLSEAKPCYCYSNVIENSDNHVIFVTMD